MKIDSSKIADVLLKGGVIVFVTDTVWGIGCLPSSEEAVSKIYALKGRESDKPLILMSNSIYNLLPYVENPSEKAQKLIDKHFPGALTLVLKKTSKTPALVSQRFDTVGIRVPNNETFKKLCEKVPGKVLATTSANLSGGIPAMNFEEASQIWKDHVDLVLPDMGNKPSGEASTVVGVFGDEMIIFRQGKIKL